MELTADGNPLHHTRRPPASHGKEHQPLLVGARDLDGQNVQCKMLRSRLASVALLLIACAVVAVAMLFEVLPLSHRSPEIEREEHGFEHVISRGGGTAPLRLKEWRQGWEDGAESSSSGSRSSDDAQKPNVVFILIDDVGMNDIGMHSSDLWELTPFIDSLARDGVVLTNYYTDSLCTPSRVSSSYVGDIGFTMFSLAGRVSLRGLGVSSPKCFVATSLVERQYSIVIVTVIVLL